MPSGFAFSPVTRPDWVMCGMTLPTGGVRLLASQQLNRADLEAIFDHRAVFEFDPVPLMTSYRIILTTEMRTFVVIDAPDYPAAFQALFEQWTPGQAPSPAIGEGQREITR